ncbi:uncharacterized protein TNCV_1906861 [Trichonephila clavipes]|nr:uncharacterized protein TNCV_1906861 [Trichonephila clavipes]
MDVCKRIVPLRHGGTLNSRRAASPLVWLVEGEERWDALDHPQVSSLKIGVETSPIVLSPAWCSKLRLTTGVKILALSRDEFRGPRYDFVSSLQAHSDDTRVLSATDNIILNLVQMTRMIAELTLASPNFRTTSSASGEAHEATRKLRVTDFVILNLSQETRKTPELVPSLQNTTPGQREYFEPQEI